MDQSLSEKLDLINDKLDLILKRLGECESSCKKMDDHIHFVENTYTTLRHPLDYIRRTVNSITGTQNEPLNDLPNVNTKNLNSY